MLKLILLFYELFKISLFVIGGGYAIIAVADDVFAKRKWTKEGELVDNLPVFQMIPGLIATHTAVYVGRKVAGALGATIGVIAVALPSIVIFTFVSMGYDALPLDNPHLKSAFVGLRSALTGIIAASIIRSWKRTMKDFFAYALTAAALVALVGGVAVPVVLISAMVIGISKEHIAKRDEGGALRTYSFSLLPFYLFLKYGMLCFGGGFVLVPMYIEDFVGPSAAFLQITTEEFSNLMALTQMTPGPIGVNGATFFGFRLAGISGAILASAGLLLPGSLLATLAFTSLERFQKNRIVQGLLRGVRPASLALMIVALAAFAKMSVFAENELNFIALILVITSIIGVLMKKINIILLVVLCAAAGLVARAENITVERFPDADVVLVNDITKVKYNPDGTYDEVSEVWSKILTEKGRREESSLALHYSRRYGTMEVLYVGAIDTNGVERVIDVKATTRDMTDNSSMGANIYDPLDRRIVTTIPGLKVGETVHLKMRRKSFAPRCVGVWSNIYLFESFYPMLRSEVVITAPKERPLKKIAIRNPLGNVTESKKVLADGSIVHTFISTESPQAFPEPDMPKASRSLQHLRVSTAENWPEISRWYWNLSLPHLQKETPEMTNKVAEVTKGLTSREDQMRAIFKFVSQEIRYMGLTMEDTSPGYAPHDIDITFNNRYGVCRDKAALLVALLRIGGFEAYPVLIHVGDKRDKDVPQPFFNHAIVGVVNPTSTSSTCAYTLMDPTNENAKDLFPAYESNKSYLVCRPEGEDLRTSEVPSPEHNALKVASKGWLEKDGSLVLDTAIDFGGINDTNYRNSLVKKTPEERVKYFERIVKSIAAGAELVSCTVKPTDMRDTESPIRVEIFARFPEMILKGETRDELSIPEYSRRLGLVNHLFTDNTALAKRRFDLIGYATALGEETLDIDLGDAVGGILHLPETAKLEGALAYTREFAVTNGHLYAHRKLAATEVEIKPDEYLKLRAALKEIEAADRKCPVFKENLLADADVKWISDVDEVDVISDREWVETSTVKKEILTYQGKKSSAELKLGYNPAVEAVELVSAVVSNRDGRVYSVSPKEMNVMDCGWAGAAPRYLASKLLVVNLPSVEIGSVISYTIRSSVTNAPAPFYGVYNFDSYEPLLHRKVRINDHVREVARSVRLPREPGQPIAGLWRDQLIVSSNRIGKLDLKLTSLDPEDFIAEPISLLAIRNWMTKQVKVAGPGVWELPFDLQLTDPTIVLKERYASPLDYARTMCALMRGAGYEADVVLAAANANDPESLKRRVKFEKPNLRAFAYPLCRVTVTEGGFLGLGGVDKTYFIGTENEYAELGASAFEGSDYLDPETGAFGVVTVPDEELKSRTEEVSKIKVAEDGSIEMKVRTRIFGSEVAGFRRRFAEILPEDRSRYYQSLLSSVAKAAVATSELKTEIKDYPAMYEFSCRIPNYAMVNGDSITLQVPALLSSIPTFTGKARKTPFAIGAENVASEFVDFEFPKGYTIVEHLPDSFSFEDLDNPCKVWLFSRVDTKVEDDRLTGWLIREVSPRDYEWYSADKIELVKDRSRISSSRANRTIVVRKPSDATTSKGSDPVIGNWGLALPYDNMNAGHMIVERQADGKSKALVLWRWASPEPVKSCEIIGKRFKFVHPWHMILEGEVCGDELTGTIQYLKEDDSLDTSKKIEHFKGWRNPPIIPAHTADAQLGEPIDLLKDGLDGWVTMDPKAKFGWSIKVENGEKILSNCLGLKPDGSWAGGGANLRTKRTDFYDFNLEYDVRVPKKSNSGVYLRGRYECQVVDSYGETPDAHSMAAYYGRVVPSTAAAKKPGEWQHVSVTLYKRHLTVVLNGIKIIDDAPVVGITGGAIDANEFVPGPIYLQGDHSDADYKNMILRPVVRDTP